MCKKDIAKRHRTTVLWYFSENLLPWAPLPQAQAKLYLQVILKLARTLCDEVAFPLLYLVWVYFKKSGKKLGNIDKTIQSLLTGRMEKNIVSIVLQKMWGITLQAAVKMPDSEIQQAADFHIQAMSSAMLMESYPDLATEQQAALHTWSSGLSTWCGCRFGQEQKQRIKEKQRLKEWDWRTYWEMTERTKRMKLRWRDWIKK